jgi:hypothetical protein
MVFGLGELGQEPRDWLDDPHIGVRVCAALAPALAADDRAIEVLQDADQQPEAVRRAFGRACVILGR